MPFFSRARHGFLLFCRDRIHFRFEKEARVKGHHSAGRDHHDLARAGIPPRAGITLAGGGRDWAKVYHFYFRDDPSSNSQYLTRDGARRIASNIG